MFVRLFVDENLDRHVPISKQPKEKIQVSWPLVYSTSLKDKIQVNWPLVYSIPPREKMLTIIDSSYSFYYIVG